MSNNIPFKKLNSLAKIPTRATSGDAGLDLCSTEEVTIEVGGRRGVGTGLAVAIPYGSRGQIHERSGLALNKGIAIGGGVIDCGYRGELKVILINHGTEPFSVKIGDKIAQLVIDVVNLGTPIEVETLDETERGEKGFGSSDKKREITSVQWGSLIPPTENPTDEDKAQLLKLKEQLDAAQVPKWQKELLKAEGVPVELWNASEEELIKHFKKSTGVPHDLVLEKKMKKLDEIRAWFQKMLNSPGFDTLWDLPVAEIVKKVGIIQAFISDQASTKTALHAVPTEVEEESRPRRPSNENLPIRGQGVVEVWKDDEKKEERE
ncbi:Deoxyuridine 5'-triphosphate nucleotidohydrolase [Kaumoebavirus]|uniref:dUTPase n=1 Tax=Kaumoebavirus TaxID=1859492 RepID=UPI0009C2EDC1|nr:dUTPase [Kaumoebavirus]ARA72171.1 Deoxyuridine 5'-triphosphate nucleotidohydrolase [Kaumoebavirus]